MNDKYIVEGYELCYNCETEFEFKIEPYKSVLITCPVCGAVQHPCSLCYCFNNDCSGKSCCKDILKSLGEEI